MKVLYVGSDTMVCGASFSMAKLIEEIEKNDIEVVPVVRHGNTEQILIEQKKKHYIVDAWSWIISNDIPKYKQKIYIFVKKVLNIKCYFQYVNIIKKEKPDIVHLNTLTTYVAAKAAFRLNVPVVWHIREMLEEDLNAHFWNDFKAHKLMKNANCFIAISKCVEDKYKKIVGPDKIRCIYNGIDKAKFLNEHHEIFQTSKIIVTMAGRITPQKGQAACLKAMIPILKEDSRILLQFAGTGSEDALNELQEIKKMANLNDNQVVFLGFVKDMNRLWAETDIAIVYSKYEAFGRVTVEAKMAGALVVGYDSGGTSELILDEIDGFLFDDKSNKLTEVMRKILKDKQRSKRIAANGRMRVVDTFTAENNGKNVCRLYREILKDSRT